MIEVHAAGNAGLMAGLLDAMGQGGAARARLYTGARGNTTTLVALVLFAEPAGSLDADGNLVLAPSVESVVQSTGTPTWARISNGHDAELLDVDARTSTQADDGQELVVQATALLAGGRVQVVSGTLSALP